MTRWILLVGLVACSPAQPPPATPITVTTTAPDESQIASPAPASTPSDSSAPDAAPPPPPEPQVHSGPTSVTGRRAPEGVQSIMGAHMPAFSACYKAEDEAHRVNGTQRLRIMIDGAGHVSSAMITAPSTLKDDVLSRCILKIVRAITFDKPAQGTAEVTYSLVFSP